MQFDYTIHRYQNDILNYHYYTRRIIANFNYIAARQICWRPAILFYRCSLDLSFIVLFFVVRGRLHGRSSPNFATCSMVTQICKIP